MTAKRPRRLTAAPAPEPAAAPAASAVRQARLTLAEAELAALEELEALKAELAGLRRRNWLDAVNRLRAQRGAEPLTLQDLEELATVEAELRARYE